MKTIYPDWLMRLEGEAVGRLNGHRHGFTGGEFACPWLRWYFLRHRNKRPETVLVLQDWDAVEPAGQSIMDAIKLISSPGGGRGVRNLFGREDTGNGLQNGTLCVMNAVWGLRPEQNLRAKGLLTKSVHRAAWPVWTAALRHLRPTRQLITAGPWAAKYEGLNSSDAFLGELERHYFTEGVAPKLRGVSHEQWEHPSHWGAVR